MRAESPGADYASPPEAAAEARASAAGRRSPMPYVSVFDREQAERPGSALELALRNFVKECRAIGRAVRDRFAGVEQSERLPGSLGLTLDDAAVAEREREREQRTKFKSRSPFLTRFAYEAACRMLDIVFVGRPIARFWFLETVARMPYFSYLSVLHLYETFGWLHIAELRKIHFAEEWNEMHHLLIMSSLGGDARWSDRLLGFHLSLVYYWGLVVLYLASPAMAYNFSELLETHAVDTYTQFLDENAERLKELSPPGVAVQYYRDGDMYLFDEFHTDRGPETRRPPVSSLYDVFANIRDDESEHVKTMVACQDYSKLGTLVSSPHEKRQPAGDGGGGDDGDAVAAADGEGGDDDGGYGAVGDVAGEYRGLKGENRERWLRWAEAVNRDARARAQHEDAPNESGDAGWKAEMERQRAHDEEAWQAKMERMRAAAAEEGNGDDGDEGQEYEGGLGV